MNIENNNTKKNKEFHCDKTRIVKIVYHSSIFFDVEGRTGRDKDIIFNSSIKLM